RGDRRTHDDRPRGALEPAPDPLGRRRGRDPEAGGLAVAQKREVRMTLTDASAEPLVGPARVALNHSSSSIHDPEHAKRLGFRGPAVGGNLHLDIFAPLLVEAYGRKWFEKGALSLYFLNIVVSGEPVQAVVERPASPGVQTRVHARRADEPGFIVCEGTASL